MALYNTWYGPSCQLYSSYCQVQQWILKHIQRTNEEHVLMERCLKQIQQRNQYILYGGFQIEHVNLQLAF